MITHAGLIDRLLEFIGAFAEVHAYSDFELRSVPISLLMVAVNQSNDLLLRELGDLTVRTELRIVTGRLDGRAFSLGVVELHDGENLRNSLHPCSILEMPSMPQSPIGARISWRKNPMHPGM